LCWAPKVKNMPTRLIDFDALWSSDKLFACTKEARREYAWLYGLADAHGSFELTNLRVVHGRVAAIREDLSIEQLGRVFDEFHDKGLLFTWDQSGKRYGHWTNCESRLPPKSIRSRYKPLAPEVPEKALQQYLAGFSNRTSDSVKTNSGSTLDDVMLGEGDGEGKGKGKGKGKGEQEPSRPSDAAFPPPDLDSSLQAQNPKRTPLVGKARRPRLAKADADHRHSLVIGSCYQAYSVKHGQPPTWGGKDHGRLREFLAEHPAVSVDEIACRYGHLLASTDAWHAKKGDSLAHLLTNFDTFAFGPIRNEEPKSFDQIRREKTDDATRRLFSSLQEKESKQKAIEVPPLRLSNSHAVQLSPQPPEHPPVHECSEEELQHTIERARLTIYGDFSKHCAPTVAATPHECVGD
jgi:hypothetical protein